MPRPLASVLSGAEPGKLAQPYGAANRNGAGALRYGPVGMDTDELLDQASARMALPPAAGRAVGRERRARVAAHSVSGWFSRLQLKCL